LRLRRARTLVIVFTASGPELQNYMARQKIPCTGFDFDLLTQASTWQAPQYFHFLYPAVNPVFLTSRLEYLAATGFLVIEESAAGHFDMEYESFWKWDATAGLYHFAMKDPPFLNPQQANAWLAQYAAATPPVPLWTTNAQYERVEQLPAPDLNSGLLEIMNRRRSVRAYVAQPISLESLRDCLFAGMAITGFLDTHLPESTRLLPLKMTPSGGGRNPYEAYVYALNVRDLQFGVYHYSAIENSLGLLTRQPAVTATQLLAGQYWADDAAAVILLVANFERTMWKYPNPTAYRVVLIESGHIAQNIALAAANNHLTATPTAAVNDTAASVLLGVDWIQQALVLAVLIGKAHPDAAEVQNFVPHRCS